MVAFATVLFTLFSCSSCCYTDHTFNQFLKYFCFDLTSFGGRRVAFSFFITDLVSLFSMILVCRVERMALIVRRERKMSLSKLQSQWWRRRRRNKKVNKKNSCVVTVVWMRPSGVYVYIEIDRRESTCLCVWCERIFLSNKQVVLFCGIVSINKQRD